MQNIKKNKKSTAQISDMSYFVKFKFFETSNDQEPYRIQKYEVDTQRFEDLSKLLPQCDGSYTINYVDSDGDLCTIDNDRTLKVALKTVPSSSTLTLRIHHKASGSRSFKKSHENKSTMKTLRTGG